MNAQHRILAGHGVGANRADQVAARQCQHAAPGLAGQKTVGARGNCAQQRVQLSAFKVVKKQVHHDDIPARRHFSDGRLAVAGDPVKHVAYPGAGPPAQRGIGG